MGTGTAGAQAKTVGKAAVGGGVAATVAQVAATWFVEWAQGMTVSETTIAQTETGIFVLGTALLTGLFGFARERRIPILGSISIVAVAVMTLGCAGVSGKWGGAAFKADGNGARIVLESPDFIRLGCGWGWSEKIVELTGLSCDRYADEAVRE